MDEERTIENDWESQLNEYMLGTMEPGAAAEFEQGLVECRTHVTLAHEYSQVVGWLGVAVPPAEPPEGHKNRLLARVATTQQAETGQVPAVEIHPAQPTSEPPAQIGGRVTDLSAYRERRRIPGLVPALGAIAAALVLLAGVWSWSILQQPSLRDYVAVQVKGQAPMPSAAAVALVNPNKNDVRVVASGLQPLPSGQIYELWLLPPSPGAVPVPAGTFSPDANGAASHDARAPANLSQFAGVAVSVEQAPGLSAGPPKGPVVLVGQYDLH
jgi:anti-sigma-K factor RskA